MKKILFLLTAVLIILSVNAQNNLQDVVYLKNGSVIRGLIIEQIPNVNIKLKTIDGNIFVYRIDEIEKMTREEINPQQIRTPSYQYVPASPSAMTQIQSSKYGVLKTGYVGEVSMAAGALFTPNMAQIEVSTIQGYRFLPALSVGIGVGYNYYTMDMHSIPIYFNLSSRVMGNADVSLYVSTDIGANVFVTDSEVAFLFRPCLGTSIRVAPNNNINIGAYFSLMSMNGSTITGLGAKVGFTF